MSRAGNSIAVTSMGSFWFSEGGDRLTSTRVLALSNLECAGTYFYKLYISLGELAPKTFNQHNDLRLKLRKIHNPPSPECLCGWENFVLKFKLEQKLFAPNAAATMHSFFSDL